MGTESQGHAGFDNAMVMLMIMLKQEEKPENIGMRTVMTTMTSYCQFFSFQRCGTMGTESQGYVGSDNDCTDDAEELEQKPERFKIRSKMTLMAWIKIFFCFSFPSLQWYGTHGSRKPRRWQTLTMTAGNTCCVWRQGKLAPVSCCHLVTSLNAARHLKWWPSDWQGFDG